MSRKEEILTDMFKTKAGCSGNVLHTTTKTGNNNADFETTTMNEHIYLAGKYYPAVTTEETLTAIVTKNVDCVKNVFQLALKHCQHKLNTITQDNTETQDNTIKQADTVKQNNTKQCV